MGPIDQRGVQVSYLTFISTILIFIALIASHRLFIGPTIYDRLISLNVAGVILTIVFIIMSIDTGMGFYVDIAISFTLLNFIGTVAFAKYLEGGEFI